MIYSWIKIKRTLVFVVSAVVLLFGVRGLQDISAAQKISLSPPTVPIPRTLFGMHIHHTVYGATTPTPWPSIPFGTWRLWDAYVTWPNLEPKRRQWDFRTLDKYVALAEEHDVEILLPLGLSPAWASSNPGGPSQGQPALPKNMVDWQDYVRTVATRYKGRIHDYEIWNEPNSKGFYTGSIPQLVALAKAAYTILKQVDPSNEVVSPSATYGYRGASWLDDYLKAGGGKYADIIGFHFYVSPQGPEAMVPLIERVKQVMAQDGVGNKPLWCTEVGWYIQDTAGSVKSPGPAWPVLSLEQASDYVARAYILSWASGASRLYWYAWDNGNEGLVGRNRKTLKAPAVAYEQVEKWLVGARMWHFGRGPTGYWACPITRPGNYRAWVIWRSDREKPFLIPEADGVKVVRELNGTSYVPPANRVVNVGPSPILLVSPGS